MLRRGTQSLAQVESSGNHTLPAGAAGAAGAAGSSGCESGRALPRDRRLPLNMDRRSRLGSLTQYPRLFQSTDE